MAQKTLKTRRPAQPRPRHPAAQAPSVKWMTGTGGYAALSAADKAAAERSYAAWSKRQPAAAATHDLADYVHYVQQHDAQRRQEAQKTGTKAVRGADKSRAPSERLRALENALAGKYETPALLLPFLASAEADLTAGKTILRLKNGEELHDHGDRISWPGGDIDTVAAEATAAAAAAHGWTQVQITGDQQYRDAVAIACALREPPIQTDHVLSQAAVVRLADIRAQRARAAIQPLDVTALRALVQTDPVAAALQRLDHRIAIERAALAGKPLLETSVPVLQAEAEETLVQRRQAASDTLRIARATADDHRRDHGLLDRLTDSHARARQRGFDAAVSRADADLRRLSAPDHRRGLLLQAQRAARAAQSAYDDWRWSEPVVQADRRLHTLIALRAKVLAGNQAVREAVLRGDYDAAARAMDAGGKPDDLQSAAIRALREREDEALRAGDVRAVAGLRAAQEQAIRGSESVIAAAATGNTDAAIRQATRERKAAEVAPALEPVQVPGYTVP